MIGLLLWKLPEKRGRSLRVGERSILHMRFTCAEITRGSKTPEAVLRRRVSAAGKRLRKLGITRAVLPEDFAYQELLERQGIRAVSTVTLRRALAADWARAVMETGALSPGTAKVAVAGSQLTGELVRTVTELSLRNRYVLLDLPYGGEELCRQLRREYGVTLLLSPAKEQLEGADVLLLFDRREDLKPGGVGLPLYEGAQTPLPPLLLPPAMEERLPAGTDRGQLLAALREAGALRPGQITVGLPRMEAQTMLPT